MARLVNSARLNIYYPCSFTIAHDRHTDIIIFNFEKQHDLHVHCGRLPEVIEELLINKEIPKVTYYHVLILNLNLKCIINFLKVILISKEYFI